MKTMLLYLAQVIAASGILYAYYHMFLRNKKFHQYNRFYLLAAVCISISIPFLQIPVYFTSTETDSSVVLKTWQSISYPVVVASPEALEDATSTTATAPFDWSVLLYCLYATAGSVLLLRMVLSLYRIRRIIRHNAVEEFKGVHFVNTTEPGTPFSFFRWLFWHRRIDLSSSKGEYIFRHEIFHIRQKHSVDIIFLELISVIFWINPFFHIIRRELKAIHEFLADRFAAAEDSKWEYSELLLMQVLNTRQRLVNPFFHNQIKRRIAMITNSSKTGHQYLRKMLVLPVAALVTLLFAFQYRDRQVPKEILSPAESKFTIVIDAGHGGSDIGAKSPDAKHNEAALSLEIAQLIQQLAPEYNINVIMTREGEALPMGAATKDEGLKNRLMIAGKSNADAFISIHVNTTGAQQQFQNKRSGFEVYVSAQPTDGKDKWLAAYVLKTLSSIYTTEKTIRQRSNPGIYVLEDLSCPALVIECGYIDNQKDLAFITSAANQEKMARGILESFIAFHNSGFPTPVNSDTTKAFLKDLFRIGLKLESVRVEHPGFTKDNKNVVPDLVVMNNMAYSLEEFRKKIKDITLIEADTLLAIPPDNAAAEKKYGQMARNGLIELKGAVLIRESTAKKITPALDSSFYLKGIRSASPLVVVNGILQEGSLSSEQLNSVVKVDDIASVTILKDANAVSKYGERAKDGVIEIVTKASLEEVVVEDRRLESVRISDARPGEVKEGPKTKSELTEVSVDKVFEKVEIEPAFPGGVSAWREYLSRNLDGTIPSKKKAPAGTYTIYVQFIVNRDGSIHGIKPLTNHGFGMEEEAIRVIRSSPNWLPAVQNGNTVTAYRKQPITFVVTDKRVTAFTLPEVVAIAYIPKELSRELIADREPVSIPETTVGSLEWRKYFERSMNGYIPVSEGWKPGVYHLNFRFKRNDDGSITDVKALSYANSKTAAHCVQLIRTLGSALPSSNTSNSGYYVQPLSFVIEDSRVSKH